MEQPPAASPRYRRAIALIVASGSGFAIMDAEIATGRLLAPYYGTSTTTWAILIATVLFSLALGNVFGGYLSQRRDPTGWLRRAMLGAAALLASVPHLGRWLLGGSLARLQSGQIVLLGATLVFVALLLTLPLVLLGTVTPLLLHTTSNAQPEQRISAEVGRTAGELGAAATVGSLLGTLGSGLVFIPWLGTSRTLWLGSAVLSFSALALRRGKPWRDHHVETIIAACVLCAAGGTEGASPRVTRGKVIWQRESPYQQLTVTELNGERQLRVNDGFALQSFAFLDRRIPLRSVWAYYALAPSLTRSTAPRRALLLGLGGGTTAQIYRRLFPGIQLTGVELDQSMVYAGEQVLGIDLTGVEVVFGDARLFAMRESRRRRAGYDVIILDAFQFPYIPFHLATREFFLELDALLADGGVVMVNVGRFNQHREVVQAVARTLASVFAAVQAAEPPNRTNSILVGSHHAPDRGVGMHVFRLPPVLLREIEFATTRVSPFRVADWPPHTPLLTDDHAPVEWLTDRILWRSLLEAARNGRGLGS